MSEVTDDVFVGNQSQTDGGDADLNDFNRLKRET